jgi:hypothetical protein
MQLIQTLPQTPVAPHPLAQPRQLGQRRGRAAAPVEEAIDLVHDRTQGTQLGLLFF